MLKDTQITSLKCAALPAIPASALCQCPSHDARPDSRASALTLIFPGSVDGHALQIDELQGTKPTEKIDLSGKKLNVASAIIIASCVEMNDVLKELKCAAHPQPCSLR